MEQGKTILAKPYPLRMAEEIKSWIRERAQENDRSINSEINRLLRKAKEEETQQAA